MRPTNVANEEILLHSMGTTWEKKIQPLEDEEKETTK